MPDKERADTLRSERRFQILRIDGQLLRETVASWCVTTQNYDRRVEIEGVPTDVFVDGPIEGRAKSWEYRGVDDEILFRIYHESFDPVPANGCAPTCCPIHRVIYPETVLA